ncbi:TRAP transporter substrate-binding protein [Rhodoferax sp.]|uniref:TRAP transporter substrate-binding protein n=1 Tax=Rhodoferax sp. TaxID=50421 RepID=UPI0027311ACB|nr:TRAP transporter substrate-binding protein DctP [Rhodoferax sp.]MDP1530649.1 TRAP transporter substrate-binding protein DctP [Rhodoferax sp.]MDP1944712.1 TRAP transporter substrate-binding protein DctP [Rhodoferax sp.]MDP2443573.1 TRAP transporter substrate-binding protein DctP [Rhodoferax sp.]MDZ4208311.1 TRAP transporter substrate-binding protein DctP [Rhodoferax sp.]
MTLIRRKFLTTAALSGGVLSAPSLVQAQSKGTFNWKMTSAYPKGSPFYFDGPGSATDLAKRIKEMSDGRLNIQVFGAGELIPAFEGFDAVRAGTVEMNHANSYFWTGKTFAAQYFTAVPFGMNFQGMNGWLYDGGGIDLWNEVYAPFGMVAMPCGNTGVQMTGWFKKEIKTVADLKGLKMRIPGLAGKVYANLGVDVKVLPGGEIFPALERGVIDAAEFVGPFQDRRLGLHKAAKYYYTTGWHESATVSELLINKAAWQTLPKDLQAIVQNAAAACNVISEGWCQKANADAMEDLVKNQKVIAKPLPEGVIKALRTETDKVLAEAVAKDPMTKKVHDSYMAFMAKYQRWADVSEGAYHSTVRG